MTASIIRASNNLITVNVKGQLKKHEYEGLQRQAEQRIAQAGPIKILLIVEDFAGWERGADWGDLNFMEEHSAGSPWSAKRVGKTTSTCSSGRGCAGRRFCSSPPKNKNWPRLGWRQTNWR